MKFLQTIRVDDTDERVFDKAELPGAWAVSGGFVFSCDRAETLSGKRRQAFSHGFLGLGGFGWSSLVVVAHITTQAYEENIRTLADHFVAQYGAPTPEQAEPAARAEIVFAAELAGPFAIGTTLLVARVLDESGNVSEAFRHLTADQPGAQQTIWSLFDDKGKPVR